MRPIFSFGAKARAHARTGLGRGWWRVTAAGTALAAALAVTSAGGLPAASASQNEEVIVTSSGLLSPVAAVLQVGSTVVTQFHIINGVEALVPVLLEPVLAALPGITVTRTAS
jgi:outer membrane cobalamin receptor